MARSSTSTCDWLWEGCWGSPPRTSTAGILIRAKAGDGYSERGHDPHETLPYLCVTFCVTAPDRDHVTNVIKAF